MTRTWPVAWLTPMLLASLLLVSSPLQGQGRSSDEEVLDIQRFQGNVSSSGVSRTVDHELMLAAHADLSSPDGTDRLELVVRWADGNPAGLMRVEVLPRGCLTLCQQTPVAAAGGPAPIRLTVDELDTQSLHVHVYGSEGLQLARPIAGEALFFGSLGGGEQPPARPGPDPGLQASPNDRQGWAATMISMGSAGMLIVGLAAAVRPITRRWPWLPAIGLFTRLGRAELLELPVRQEILEAVHASPGIHFEALVRELGLGRGQLDHHLAKLTEARFLVEHEAAGYRAYFRTGHLPARLHEPVVLLKTPGARRVLLGTIEHPGVGLRELADAISLAPSTVNYHADRLEQAGLLVTQHQGSKRGLQATPLARRALRALPDPAGRR